jgi:hypothetical protein
LRSNIRIISLAAALMILAFSAMASVVINEMELNPPKGGAEWIELYNSGNESVDISGWTATITDGSWRGELSAVPEGTILPAGGFYVMDGQKSWNHTNGGYATLFTASGEEVDRTAFRVDSLGNDFTFGRHPDGYDTNTDSDWGLAAGTRGSSNIL